ncbi:MAG: hypothetical protein QNJ38_01505 [Prochloraceae cyanobacterium]|nr:hypothetical protein [Prochloraceae cyanobacterium]
MNDFLEGYFMASCKDAAALLADKASGILCRTWIYLMIVDRFGDRTQTGDDIIYKDIPPPTEIAIAIGADTDSVVRAMRRLKQLGLYDHRVTKWQGHNLTAYKAKQESDRLKYKRDSKTKAQQEKGEKSPNPSNPETKAGQGEGEIFPNRPKEKGKKSPKIDKKVAEVNTQQGLGEISPSHDTNIATTTPMSDSRHQCREQSPKPALPTDRGTPQTIQTNPDFSYSKSEQENLEDFWLDNEETNTKVEEFKQEQTSQLVEAETIDQQTETVSTSDKETTTAIVANPNLSQREVYSACSTFERKLKHRAANPKQTNMDRLQEALNWIPDGVWCTEPGKLDPEFVKWSVSWWMERFDCKDKYEAKANVLAYYKNDLSKLVIRWEQYSETYLAKYENADLRLSHGCTVGIEEEKELKNNVRAVAKPLPPEMSYEDKGLQQNTNSVAPLSEVQQNRILVETKKPIAQEEIKSDRATINDNNKSIASLPTDEYGAVNNAEAYKPWKPEKDDNPATTEQMQALKEKLAKFRSNFGKGLKTEPKKSRSQLLNEKLDRLKRELQDDILRPNAIATAEKEGYELIKNKFGDVVGLDLPF